MGVSTTLTQRREPSFTLPGISKLNLVRMLECMPQAETAHGREGFRFHEVLTVSRTNTSMQGCYIVDSQNQRSRKEGTQKDFTL